MIWKTYKYIYYWLYTWQKKLWGKNDVPEFNAVVGMSMSLAAFLASLAIIFELISGIQLIPSDLSQAKVALVGILFLAFHYLVFMFNGEYLKIEKEFKAESKRLRMKKGVFVLLYTFVSLALFIFLLFFGIWIQN